MPQRDYQLLQQDPQDYKGYRQPGLRLTEDFTPTLREHQTESLGDLMPGVHSFDKAHLVMLVEQGIITREAGVAMLRGLRVMEEEGVERTRLEAQGGYHSGEQYFIRTLGEDVGGWIHVGRSSGDMGEVSRRLAIRGHLLDLMDAINGLRQAIAETAPRYFDAVMPGYSGGQNAQPTTYGHWLTMWVCVLERDFSRASELYSRLNQSPAGGAILTGTDFPISRERTAELLGFDAPLPHTMDAVLSHDTDCLETASFLALHATNLMRLADDIQLWSTSEYSFLDAPDRFCGTSSIMPQKKNPSFCFRTRTTGSEAVGGIAAALRGDSGPTAMPLTYMTAVEHSLWAVFPGLVQRLNEATELIPALTVNRRRMHDVAERYWAQATDLAAGIVRARNLNWRSAHQIVAILVRITNERDIAPMSVTPALVDEAAKLYFGRGLDMTSEELAPLLSVDDSVARRTLFGGPEKEAAARELRTFVETMKADIEKTDGRRRQIAQADALLEAAIDNLLDRTNDSSTQY